METLHAWFAGASLGRLRLYAVAALTLAGIAGVTAAVTGEHRLTPWVGGGAGLVLYGAAHGWWMEYSGPTWRDRLDLKGTLEVRQRRLAVLVGGLFWCALLVVAAEAVPQWSRALLGACQVALILAAINLCLPGPGDGGPDPSSSDGTRPRDGDEHGPARGGVIPRD